jgi:hypothetical protein
LLGACGGGGGDGGGWLDGPVNLGVAAGDLDHNGSDDVAVVGADLGRGVQYVNVYLRGPNGAYAAPINYTIAAKDDSIMAVDLNADGLPDLIGFNSTDSTGRIPILFNEPARPGTFDTTQTLSTGGTVNVLTVGDLNGDGLADIVVNAGGQIEVFLQNRQTPGTFSSPRVVSSAGTGAVAIGDLNADKVPDIAMATAAGLTVLSQSTTAPGSYQAVALGTIADAGTHFVYIDDVDGDGLGDLIVNGPLNAAGASSVLWVLLQDKQNPGHFLAPASYPTLGDAFNVVVVDLTGTGSGLPALVVGASSGVSVLLPNPAHAGTFLSASQYTQTGGSGLAVADVNGDGLPDLIVPGPNLLPKVMLQDSAHPGSFLTPRDL